MTAVISNGANSVTATQLVRDLPEVRRMADHGPVQITSHGRTELVIVSPDHFAQYADGAGADSARLEGKLDTVLAMIDTAVMIFDENLRVTRVNPAMCHLMDADPPQIVGLHGSEMVSHPSHRYTVDRMAEVQRSGHPEVITAASARDNSRTLQIKITPWPNGIALFADDITDRMRLGDLVIADQMMDTALAGLGCTGTAQVRSDGTILSASKGLAQMAGASPKALIGARLQNLLSPQSRGIVNDAFRKASDQSIRHSIDYLRNGVSVAPATISIASYWTAENQACAAIALHDPLWEEAQP